MDKILTLFHHIHHFPEHEVHHCGGEGHDQPYTIRHCRCGKHRIDTLIATGHDFDNQPQTAAFYEKCPEGGWHVESGRFI